jgi:hypothetical protein
MQTILQQQSVQNTYNERISKPSVFSKFINWCSSQEEYRFGWLAGILAVHGCALTPITLFAIILSGTNIIFFIAAIVAMGAALVTNLAAMPAKIVLPVFFLSVLIDLIIIVSCVVVGFDIAGTYV